MVHQDAELSGSQEKPNTGFNLDLLARPAASMPTSVGTLYLYSLRTSDLSAARALTGDGAADRIRAFLPHIASLTEAKGLKDERPPLSTELIGQLAETEVEKVAERYAALLFRKPGVESEDEAQPVRDTRESAIGYLDRLLKHEVEQHSQQMLRLQKRFLASTSSVFDQVRRSTSTLGSTVSAFERFTKDVAPVEIRAPSIGLHVMDEQFARQRRERAEELEMVRLTGKMTAESAKTLKDLAEAATVLLEQLDERDRKADSSTRKQITIAVWSVGTSAVLALVALIFSGLAYFQDKASVSADDKWQTELISAVRDISRHRDAYEIEAQRMRARIVELEAKVTRVESVRRGGESRDGRRVVSDQPSTPSAIKVAP